MLHLHPLKDGFPGKHTPRQRLTLRTLIRECPWGQRHRRKEKEVAVGRKGKFTCEAPGVQPQCHLTLGEL